MAMDAKQYNIWLHVFCEPGSIVKPDSGGSYYTNFLHSIIFPLFFRINKTLVSCWSAAGMPVKYENDWSIPLHIVAKSNLFLADKLTNRALVTPALGLRTEEYACIILIHEAHLSVF